MTEAILQKARVDEVAAAYRAKGYEVSVQPRPEELPPFLAGFQPDLMVKSGQDKAVVEVKTPGDLGDGALVGLAKAVEPQPEWRLEVHVVSVPSLPELPDNGELLSQKRINAMLDEARVLHQQKRYDAAAMMAWAAAEGMFRRMARARGAKVQKRFSGTILKQLWVFGMIDDYEYFSFWKAMEFRDAFAHGFKAKIAPRTITRFIRDVEGLKGRRPPESRFNS